MFSIFYCNKNILICEQNTFIKMKINYFYTLTRTFKEICFFFTARNKILEQFMIFIIFFACFDEVFTYHQNNTEESNQQLYSLSTVLQFFSNIRLLQKQLILFFFSLISNFFYFHYKIYIKYHIYNP